MRLPLARLVPLAAVLLVALAGCRTKDAGCPAGQLACGLGCVDTATSAAHCGGCNQPCGLGSCSGGTCQCDAAAATCPDGVYPRCADTQHDPEQCGASCVACKQGAACDLGTCACPVGTTDCPAACVDTATDPLNCGGCGIACGGGRTCEGGQCLCKAPRTDCGAAGCFDFLTDERHCGTACANVVSCPATATCVAGACDCPGSQVICGTACADLATDEANCGLCGRACATGGVCTGGACSCPVGLPDRCTSPDRCVDFASDEANCGACGARCSTGQVCQSEKCCAPSQQVCVAGASRDCCDGGCCLDGTCRVAHSNGLGQTYFSCDPVPTYSFGAAQAAANAWLPTGGTDFVPVFACLPSNCYCRQGPTSAATWCYDSLLVGQVSLNTVSTACLCPPQGNVTGPWN